MTLEQAFSYIFNILDDYYKKTLNDELGIILGGLDPNLFVDLKTADPAAWHDWIRTVKKITTNENITKEEALKAMILLLKQYNDNEGFDLADVIEHFANS